MNHPVKILLVDDDSVILKATRLTLEAAGYAVSAAATGAEGLRLAATQPPDLALLDRVLPDIDGVEVCRRLKANPATAHIFVALMSGMKTSGDDRADGLETGADDYIARPVSNRELLARVQALLRIKKAEDALRASEERYRLITDHVADIVWQLDMELRFVYLSPAVEHVLGYTAKEVLGLHVTDFLNEEGVARMKEVVQARLKNLDRTAQPTEYKMKHKSGDWVDVEVVSSPVFDDSGHPIGFAGITRDITARKQAEEQLRQSEAALKQAQQVAHVGSWKWRIQSNRLEWSDEMYHIFGLEKETFSGELSAVIERAIHPDDRAAVEQANLSVIKDRQPVPLEYRVVWADGTVRVVRAEAGELTLDDDGNPVILTGIVQDITARKQTEEALRAALEAANQSRRALLSVIEDHRRTEETLAAERALLRTLVDHLPDSIYVKDTATRKTLSNPADFHNMGAIAEAEVLGKTDFELFPHDLAEGFYADDLYVLQTGQPVLNREEGITRSDGTRGWQLTSKIPVRDSAGQVIGLVGIGHDITERKQAEELLRWAGQRYRSLFEEAPLMYVITRNQEGVPIIVDCNRAFLSALGYTRDEVIERSLADLYTPESRAALLEGGYQRAMGDGLGVEERRLVARDGHIIETILTALPETDAQGNVTGTRAMYVDITARKQAEETIRANEIRFRELFDNMSSGVVVYEALDDGQDFILKDFNRAGERIEGIEREALIGRSILEAFPGVQEFGLFEVLQRVWRTGQPEHHPVSRYRDERGVSWRENYVCKLPSGEIVAIYDDVTQRQLAESQKEAMLESLRRSMEKAARGQRLLLALNQAAQAVQRAQTPEEIYRTVGEEIGKLGYHTTIFMLTGDPLCLVASYMSFRPELLRTDARLSGAAALDHPFRLEPGSFYGRVIAEGKTVFSDLDFESIEEALPRAVHALATVLGFDKVIYAPLKIDDQVQGLLVVIGADLTAADVLAIEVFADQLAVGIQQARMHEQIQRYAEELEQQVAARTAELARRSTQLQVAAEVARDATTAHSLDELLTRAADLIRERFGFYHAGIFLVDKRGEYAVLRAATGEAGRQMLEHGQKLKVGEVGIVGYVTGVGKPRIALAAGADAVHFENPFLPETRSEMALPLRAGGQTIGALDVQSTQAAAFDAADVEILQVMADQLAVAIERTRLFERTQTALEERLRMVISNVPVILFTLDREGVYTLSEGKGLAVLGLEPGEAVGRPLTEVFPNQPDLATHVRRALAGETFMATVKLGDRVFESWYGPLRDEAAEVYGVTGVCIDITERHTLEAQIHRQERLAAVGQLAGGIAHDFNNFLTTIIMYAGLLARTKRFPADAASTLQVIVDEARRAAQLVRQILDFSRRSAMEVQPIDLVAFIQETIDILRKTIPENIAVLMEASPGRYVINADPTRIQQVLMNLALNARDAMPDGGQLRVSLSRVHTAHTDSLAAKRFGSDSAAPPIIEGEWIRLSVSDTGTGMKDAVRAHLFEPFFTTKGPKGTGLGLAQVYGIVKQHGGEVNVETELGRGTTFHIDLPVYHRASPAREEPAAMESFLAPQANGETILLVEDEDNVRHASLQALESLNYRVLAAANGHAALSLYEAANAGKEIDLVITDLVMPGMGGRELLRRLREINPAVKAVALTGYAMHEELTALRAEGLVEVVYKPLDIDALAAAVHRTLNPHSGVRV